MSHTFGYANLWAENLGVPINHDAEVVETAFVEHGVNYGGGINLFGGWTEEWEQRLANLSKAKTVFSLDFPIPDYGGMLEKRRDVNSPGLIADLKAFQSRAQTLTSLDLDLDWVTVGDSHAGAWAPHGSMLVKENGKTLNGQLSRNLLRARATSEKCKKLRGITLVYGNIDVRIHILRLNADWREMWREYKRQGDSLGIEVEYAIPWPVEYEDRRLPKTGYYKGEPFYGSQAERAKLVEDIVNFADEIGMNIVQYPAEWRQEDPEQYARNRMERPGSVHLAPAMYRRRGWGEG